MPRIGCVIVTYRPSHAPLLRQIEAILPQLGMITVVDNGDGSDLPIFPEEAGIEIISLGDNFGIAHAQNIGIGRARDRGASHILLLDQDSLPAADMVARLTEGLADLQGARIAVAAVGPQYRDDRQGMASPFVYREGCVLSELPTAEPQPVHVKADFLIASGCLIPIAVLDVVGDMDEAFFIDYVDIEWGLRAQYRGFASYGIPAARMTHSLGDDWITYKGKRFPVHSTLRHYYYVRNSILLARRSWIGPEWKFILIRRMLKQFVFFSFFIPGRRVEHFRMMALGIWHGIIKRQGKR